MAARDAAVEKWLMEDVVPTIKAIDAGSMGTVSLDEAFEGFNARIKAIAGHK
jgi:hypothetical protein